LLDEVVVSVVVELLALGELEDVSLLAVPLAPMLDVLGLVELLAVLPDELVLGLVELLVDDEVLGAVLDDPPVLLSVLFSVEALVPPLPAFDASELLLVCAIAKPPMPSAAAAANVVSVFLVVVMSIAP
jgi:hypothetical protein